MPPLKPGTIRPTAEENAAINASIAADADTMEVTAEVFAQMKLVNRGGRPKLANPKRAVKLRLDPDVIDGFKARGKGWQTLINAELRHALGLK